MAYFVKICTAWLQCKLIYDKCETMGAIVDGKRLVVVYYWTGGETINKPRPLTLFSHKIEIACI